MNTMPYVKELMSETRVSVLPDISVYDAVDLLVAKKMTGIPVIDENDILVGFFTEKDCIRLQATSHQYNMTGRTVSDIMSTIQEALHPDRDLLSAANVFLRCNFSTLPVMEGVCLVGSITRQQVIHGIQRWHHKRGQEFVQEKADQKMVNNPSSIDQMQALVGKSSKQQLASMFSGRHER
ncbi:MAG: hypothetical protein COA73_03720 [Candidatus Hydrogenedentota bacterium]|nr:MAG: hypothetical protein COA73_03720 [Candidatus Hydrogenedentota bacterium]